MNKLKTSTKKAYYRRCRIHPESTQNLQQLVAAALVEKSKVKDRSEPVDAAASAFRVIAGHKEIAGMQCGTLVTFERGSYQLVVSDDPEATSLIMAAIEPPKQDGKQQQFVPGALFYAIFENHVAIVQSAALRSTAFEQHLAWLLRDQTKQLSNDQGIALIDEPRKATIDKIRKSHVKAMSIGRPFMQPIGGAIDVSRPIDETVQITNKTKANDVSKLQPVPGIVRIIKSFLPDDEFSKLNLEDAVFDGDLEVWLEIKYPARSRVQPQDTMRLLDNIAIALRDQDEESVELELVDGTRVVGSDLKISAPLQMELVSGVPQMDQFHTELANWLAKLIKNGVVSS